MRKGQSLGIVYPQMKILSSFTLPNVIPNFQSTKEDIWRMWSLTSIEWTRKRHFSKCLYVPQKKKIIQFGTTWVWVNDDSIFWVNYPFKIAFKVLSMNQPVKSSGWKSNSFCAILASSRIGLERFYDDNALSF